MMTLFRSWRHHWLVFFTILFFFAYLVVGLSIYRDYGINWDDPAQRFIGQLNINYVIHGDPTLLLYGEALYGPVFELLLIGAEKILQLQTTREIYLLRHLLTFITFYLGVIVFFFLGRKFFQKSSTALLATVALVLSPRIFEHSFYNTKDIPCLAFFILSFFTLFLYLEKRSKFTLVLHSAACALLITVRVVGLLVFLVTFYFLALELVGKRPYRASHLREWMIKLLLYFGFLGIFVYALWPVLWDNPILRLRQTIWSMSHFPWAGTTRFMGADLRMAELPWFYLPVWILITTPIPYTLLMLTGSAWSALDLLLHWAKHDQATIQKRISVFIWCFVPLFIIILMHSTVYDSWRHVYFIYPAFLLLAFWGFENLWIVIRSRFHSRHFLNYALAGLLSATFLYIGSKMVTLHPFEQMYFNRLAGENMEIVKRQFVLDYWGVSYKQGLEYLLTHEPRSPVRVKTENNAAFINTFLLTPDEQERIKIVNDIQDADYFMTNFYYELNPGYSNMVYAVNIRGADILAVYKLREPLETKLNNLR